jgi:Rrf2 family protein
MEITRRTDYAIRILMELARSGGGPVSVRTLARSQEVPYAFARGIQRDLAAAGLVESRRGAAGGAVLTRSAEQITLLDVVHATQTNSSCAVCTHDPNWCNRMNGCSVHRVWREADEMMTGYLGSKSLAGLIGQERGR